MPAAAFGTIEYRGAGFAFPAERTTAESPELEKLFRQVVDAGWKYAVMEVSSHAIAMKRVQALQFEIAVFTNLSRDHLDFHGDMDSYLRTKRQLFEGLNGVRPRIMVLNSDDPRYEDLRSIDPSRVLTYGMQAAADVCPVRHQFGWENTEAFYKTPLGELEVRTSLMGKPNLLNIGAAISVGIALGLRLEAIASGIERLGSVSGRVEPASEGEPLRGFGGFSPTDDALGKILPAPPGITPRRMIFGFCFGGEGDRSQRPPVGKGAG